MNCRQLTAAASSSAGARRRHRRGAVVAVVVGMAIALPAAHSGAQSVDELKQKHAALTLPEQMAAAAAWFRTANADEAREVAEEVIATTGVLRRALAKRGFI